MSDLIFLLILFVFVLILSATPLFRKSRSQRDYESSGMQLLATSRGRVLLLPALGCLCACIVTFFMVLMYQDIGFEASDIGSLLSCIGITILLVVVCFLGGYAMQARHVLYNEEILLIGKPFRPYQTIHWYEISEMRIKNQDFFDLYDRNGRRCVSANANLEGYRQFYQASNTPQSKKAPRTTIRCLRHPAAEHCATGPANITRSSSSMRLSCFCFSA